MPLSHQFFIPALQKDGYRTARLIIIINYYHHYPVVGHNLPTRTDSVGRCGSLPPGPDIPASIIPSQLVVGVEDVENLEKRTVHSKFSEQAPLGRAGPHTVYRRPGPATPRRRAGRAKNIRETGRVYFKSRPETYYR